MNILSVANVNKRFGGLKALNEVNLEIEAGKVHAIIGPNGAGKSTLLNCFVGRLEPDTGTVTFDGKSLLGIEPHEINQAGVSRVFQTPEIFGDLTLVENVIIPAFAKRDGSFKINAWSTVGDEKDLHTKAMDMLADVGLAEKAKDIAGQLSRGDKRRLELAMCLVQEPKLLLLDEPTAGMSLSETAETADLILEVFSDRTAIIIEHDVAFVRRIDSRVTVLYRGEVMCEGSFDEVAANESVRRVYLGDEV